MKPRTTLRRAQRGAGLFALLFWAVVVSFLGLVALKAAPTVTEYFAIKNAIRKIMSTDPKSIPEIRTAFDKQRDVEYGMESISGRDLEISEVGNQFVVSFGYDKEVPLIEPVYLLIKYRGSSR